GSAFAPSGDGEGDGGAGLGASAAGDEVGVLAASAGAASRGAGARASSATEDAARKCDAMPSASARLSTARRLWLPRPRVANMFSWHSKAHFEQAGNAVRLLRWSRGTLLAASAVLSVRSAAAAPLGLPAAPSPPLALPPKLSLPVPTLSRDAARGASERESFVDSAGRTHPFAPIQHAWFGEYGRKPDYEVALAEIAIVLGVQATNYWARPWVNQSDWDDPKIGDRVNFKAVHFDNNLAFTNFVLHPIAGGGYYWAARVNDVSLAESMLYSGLASAFWEFALEWREQVSINDLIFTPAGGIPLGAFALQLSDYLASAPDGEGVGTAVAAHTWGLPSTLAKRRPPATREAGRLPPDSLGFSSAFWHRFRLGDEEYTVSTDGRRRAYGNTLLADAEIVAMAGFLQPGHFRKLFASDNFTEAHLRVSFDSNDNEARFSGTLVGAYSQDFDAGPHGVRGHAEMIGLANGLRYIEHNYRPDTDMYSSADIMGVSGALWQGFGAVQARLLGDAHYDFAGVRPLALLAYERAHPNEILKSVLLLQGYEYSMGPSARLRAEVEAEGVTLGAYGDYAYYRTVNGMDRTQATLTRDIDAHDVIFEYGASLGVKTPVLPLFARASADWVMHDSVFGDQRVSRTDRRLSAAAGLIF
ncbi:MAG TPA: DUF3943 domain-containing protein, partial [Polyangiaceae bacterium]